MLSLAVYTECLRYLERSEKNGEFIDIIKKKEG